MSLASRRSNLLRLSVAGLLAVVAGFVLASAFEVYRSPPMIYWLDAPPLC